MLRFLLHVVGVWWEIVGVGDILALGGVDAPRGIEALGVGAVRRAVHRGAVIVLRLIHGLVDIPRVSPGRRTKNDEINSW